MTILQEITVAPQTWYMLGIMALWVLVQFLFVGDKAFARDWFKSEQKKRAEKEAIQDEKDKRIMELTEEVHALRLEVAELKANQRKNNQILQAIKDYMEENKQPTHFLELLKNVS